MSFIDNKNIIDGALHDQTRSQVNYAAGIVVLELVFGYVTGEVLNSIPSNKIHASLMDRASAPLRSEHPHTNESFTRRP